MKANLVKTLNHAAALGLLLGWVHAVSAQDSHWSGLGSGGLWSDPNNWNPVGVPPAGDPVTTYAGNVWLDAANGVSVITIPAGSVQSPGVGNSSEVYNTIFGPEWGVTLNIKGTLNYDWLVFPVQNDPTPGLRSYINIFTNGVLSTSGAALGVGDSWFYTGAPYVTVNLYGNAQHNSLGGAGLWLGGHLNIYDVATVTIGTGGGGYVNMDTAGPMSDGTRSINLGGGTLILPPGFAATVSDWINRSILRAYGKGQDSTDIVITDNGTNVVVTTAPLGGSLQRVYFSPLLVTNMVAGSFQQVTLAGDYPSVGGVLLSSSEPGLAPTAFTHPTYTSSNPQVLTVDTNGLIRAVNPGTATLTAAVGAFNSTNSLMVTVSPMGGNLIHRYSFSETSGTTAADSVAGNSPTWDGTLNGGVTLGGGQAALDGSSGYVQLPAGILTGLNEVTIETWVTFASPVNTWANLFAFGNTDLSGNGGNYINLQPHNGGNGAQLNFGQGSPAQERDAIINTSLDGQVAMHVVAVYHPMAGYEAFYTNGVLAATISMFNNLIDPVAYAGPTYNSQSILAYTLGADNFNYIGHSLYNADPTLNATLDEFRIYDGPRSAAQIKADYALGANQLIGTATNVTLSATSSSGNVIVKWPTTSALVNLMSSPVLGSGAVWTPASGTLTAAGGNYQMTVPMTGSTMFFRLQQ